MFLRKEYAGKNQFIHYLMGIFLIFFGAQVLSIFIPASILKFTLDFSLTQSITLIGNSFKNHTLNKNFILWILLFIFFTYFLLLWFIIVFIHKRKLSSYLSGGSFFRWKRCLIAFLIFIFFNLLSQIILFDFIQTNNYVFQAPSIEDFLLLFLISIVFIPFQAAFEELLLRGYLMQALTIGLKRIWLTILITSVLFASLHILNPEVAKYGFWTMIPYYLFMGIFLSIITVQDNGLEIPIGIHAGNNFLASVVFNYQDAALTTDSLFLIKEIQPTKELFSMIILYSITLIVLHKALHWRSWSFIFSKVK